MSDSVASKWLPQISSCNSQSLRTIAIVALVCLGLVAIFYVLFVKTTASYVVSDMHQRLCIERVHTMATQFSTHPTIPREAYVTNQRISSALQYRLGHKETGVFVFYVPSGYGKTTIASHVLHDLLQQGHIEGVVRLNGYDYNSRFEPKSLLDWVFTSVQCPQANIVGLSGLFASQERKTVILIDQFEALFKKVATEKIESMIHDVAMESVQSQQFVVLLLTQTEESCRMSLSWNGGQKIRPIFRGVEDPCHPSPWTRDELMVVVQRHLEDLKSYIVSDADRSRLENLIQNGNITQVGDVYNFLVDHCFADYHCGEISQAQHPSVKEVELPSVFAILFIPLILLGIFACLYMSRRYRSKSAVKTLMKTP